MQQARFFDQALLIAFLRSSHRIDELDLKTIDWELLIRQARYANLLSRVSVLLQQQGLMSTIPTKARHHFENAVKIAKANERSSHWELNDIQKVLSEKDLPFVVLKGNAYIIRNNRASAGRLFSDTDILVKRDQLLDVERKLVHSGWVVTKFDSYDQQYYRQWMYEIPPLHHTTRHTTLDVHHSILPTIVKTRFDISRFWDKAEPVDNFPGMFTLQPIDMILHSACHLFHEGEFENGLRDLADLDSLIREYIGDDDDWSELLARADTLDLATSLYYALFFSRIILHTPISETILSQARLAASSSKVHSWMMKYLYVRALTPGHSTIHVPAKSIAEFFLFIRSHWIRMPARLLLPHLMRKAFKK
jgi:hypothetical protein